MPEFYGARSEWDQLKTSLKEQNLKTQADIRKALEDHFNSIEWSLLKVEWGRLKETDKSQLVTKLLAEM